MNYFMNNYFSFIRKPKLLKRKKDFKNSNKLKNNLNP